MIENKHVTFHGHSNLKMKRGEFIEKRKSIQKIAFVIASIIMKTDILLGNVNLVQNMAM